jgi:CRP-like cAMP-binding protein
VDEKALKSIPLFAGLSKKELRRVASCTDEIDVDAGMQLVREGSFAYEFFVIREGTAAVMRDDTPIAQLGPGDFLGEMGAISRERRNASVVATCPMTLVVMTARDLRVIDGEIPKVAAQIRDAIASRSALLADAPASG